MLTTRYPTRQRCRNRKCRQFFGPLVIDGQWCSYVCAGVEAPSTNPNDWPRQHFKIATGRRVAKVPFFTEWEALASHGTRRAGVEAYRCDYCLMWHRATVRTADPC